MTVRPRQIRHAIADSLAKRGPQGTREHPAHGSWGEGAARWAAFERYPCHQPGDERIFRQALQQAKQAPQKAHGTPSLPATYIQQPLSLDPICVYIAPDRVDGSERESHTGDGGLILDRCRLVQYGYDISKEVSGIVAEHTWLNAALDRQRKGKFAI